VTAGYLSKAAELHALAVEEFNAGEPARSVKLLRRALGVLDKTGPSKSHSALAARIWISVALAESEIHGVDRGLVALHEAKHFAVDADDRTVDVLLHAQLGVIEMRRSHMDTALAHLNEAIALAEHAGPREECRMFINRGTLRLYQGDLAHSRSDLTRATRLARQVGDVVLDFKARHNLGYVEFLAGDIPTSLRLMDEASALHAPISLGIALLDRARVLTESGLVFEANRTLLEAVATFRKEGRGHDLADALLELARCALIAGDVDGARRFAAQARDRFRRRNNPAWRRSAELVLLQSDLAAGRPGLRLLGPALRLREELDADGLALPSKAAALIAVEAATAAHRNETARQILAGVGAPSARDPISLRLQHRYVIARLDAESGDRSRAAKHVRFGLRDLAAYQASFGSVDLQTAVAIHGRHLAELDIDIALQSRSPDAVFDAAERSRAVSRRLPPVRPPDDPDTAELLTELRQTVETLRAVEQDRVAAQPLLKRRRELERHITARRWTLAGEGSAAPPATVDDVQRTLQNDASTLLHYVQSNDCLHVVVVDSSGVSMHELGASEPAFELVRRARADLDVLAYPHMPKVMHDAVHASAQRSLAQLDAMLLAPLRLEAERVVVATTGLLGHVAWGALPSLRGVPVVVVPSATAWLAAAQAPSRAGGDVVALAGPDLERAAHEARGIARTWHGSVRTGKHADRETLIAALAKSRIVHIAAHGVHQTENPLFSSLRLVDGELFAHELDQTAEIAEHVILSACEVGLSTVRPGDEALGLTSVFLHFGTRSVVAGVSRVADDLAADTMIEYHRLLSRGVDSAAALAGVTAQSDQPVPFVCFGSAWSNS
jgi:tetratricopeptide (TPR) repeat protein